jgi:Kef-type K+ transport system membrane component KefB
MAEPHTVLLQLVMILLAARLVGEFVSLFKVPSVIGELIAGILLGPSLLGWVELSPPIALLAQVGIILLLFEVGLETDISRLVSSGIRATVVALLGVFLPFLFGFAISYYFFDFPFLASLFIGCTLTATSIGITLRVLNDLKKQGSNEAQVIIGAAVLDDIIGIVLLAMLFEFSTSGEVNVWNGAKIAVFILLFLIFAPLAAKLVSQVIEKWDAKCQIPGLLPTTIVSMILLFAWLAEKLGAPELLGGFAAGLALSRRFFFPFVTRSEKPNDFCLRVEEKMQPIIQLFTPIFFVAIGLSLNLKAVNWGESFIWILTSALLVVAILGKLMSSFFLRGESRLSRLIIGTAMVPRGEVGLIFANVGLTAGVLKDDSYASIILVITFTTLVAPFALRYLYQRKTLSEVKESRPNS